MSTLKTLNSEVFVAADRIVKIDRAQMDELKAQAARNPRRRARICAHKDTEDRLHEMLLVMAKDMYVHPHKHLTRSESFHVIEGSAVIVFFDDGGKVDEVFHIGDIQSGEVFYFRNDEPRWHTQIITSDFLVVHETTNGPFNRAESLFATWAPDEKDTAAAKAYIAQLERNIAPLLKR